MTLCDAASCVADDRRESIMTTLNWLELLNTNPEYSSWYTRAAAVLHKSEEKDKSQYLRNTNCHFKRLQNLERDRLNFERNIIIYNINLYSTLNLTFTRRIKWVGYKAGMKEKRLNAKFW
jgi:hypothetical protein